MLILIEGIDRTGKTTLAKRLQLFLGGNIQHFSKPEAHPIYEYTAYFANFRPAADTDILDRGHVGERVWPTIFRRPSQMDDAVFRWVDMFYRSRGAVLIHADRPVDDACITDYVISDEPLQGREEIRLAQALFEQAVTDSSLHVYPYVHGSWPGDALHDAARLGIVAGELGDITDRWVGTPAPRYLIVGGWDEHALPFMPYEDTDAHFLLSELGDDLWKQCALVNAIRPDKTGNEPLRSLWFTLGKPRVVTFGGQAADIIEGIGLPADGYGPIRDFKRLPPGSIRETIRRSGGL